MLNKRHLLAGLALTFALAAGAPLGAMDRKPFDAKAFEAAQTAGQPVLVEVSAPWCPICAKQKPILANLATKPKFKDLAHFDIDFDSQKDLLRKFNVRMQSTLIVFKGRQEVGRSTGDTNAASIERLLDKSL